jgi:hypothetical protein
MCCWMAAYFTIITEGRVSTRQQSGERQLNPNPPPPPPPKKTPPGTRWCLSTCFRRRRSSPTFCAGCWRTTWGMCSSRWQGMYVTVAIGVNCAPVKGCVDQRPGERLGLGSTRIAMLKAAVIDGTIKTILRRASRRRGGARGVEAARRSRRKTSGHAQAPNRTIYTVTFVWDFASQYTVVTAR